MGTTDLPRPYYAAYDHIYSKKEWAGEAGWNDAETDEEVLAWVDWLLEHADGRRLLELGCGAGNLSVALAGRGYDVTGLDVSPTAIRWARQRATELDLTPRFEVTNLAEEVWPTPNAYDIVLDSLFLHCVVGLHRAHCLREIHRSLRPGGHFGLMTMCGQPRSGPLSDGYDSSTGLVVLDGVAVRHMRDPDALLNEIIRAGFSLVTHRIDSDLDRQPVHDMLYAVFRV